MYTRNYFVLSNFITKLFHITYNYFYAVAAPRIHIPSLHPQEWVVDDLRKIITDFVNPAGAHPVYSIVMLRGQRRTLYIISQYREEETLCP